MSGQSPARILELAETLDAAEAGERAAREEKVPFTAIAIVRSTPAHLSELEREFAGQDRIRREAPAELGLVRDLCQLGERETAVVAGLPRGSAPWKVGSRSFPAPGTDGRRRGHARHLDLPS